MTQHFHFWIYMVNRIESRILKRYLHTQIYSALFVIAKRWKQTMCPAAGDWISNLGSTHTMSNYSALERKAILIPATTWMDIGNFMLNEVSQSQKDKHCVIPFIRCTQSRQIIEGKSEWQLPGLRGMREMGNCCLTRIGF